MTVLLHMLNVMTNVNVEALIRRNKKELLLLASTKNKKRHTFSHTHVPIIFVYFLVAT